jgi:phosphatidyl-myo-inositol alpha-mannosyltransferase
MQTDKTMKIAIVVAMLPETHRKYGGVDVVIHRLANELVKKGDFNVTVFSLTGCPDDFKYRHIQLFSRFSSLQASKIFRLLILPILLNFIDFRQFDLIHLHGDDWFFLNRRRPSVRTMHGSALNEARTATSLKRRIVQYLIYPLEHLSVKLATISLAIGRDAQTLYGIPSLIDNGVDLQMFCPGVKTLEPSILFVGTWEGRKRGQFIYEKFIHDVLPKFPNARLNMICDYCPGHEAVTFHRSPSDAELASIMRQAWIFAYPSLYEGFGLPYVEALASGTAIITSSNIGSQHILNDGEYGAIVEDNCFSQSIMDLLENPDRRSSLEIKGLSRAASFSWDSIAQSHRRFYEKAILKYQKGK